MAASALAFIYLVLTFLRTCYSRNEERLDELGLLWPPEVAGENGLTWRRFLELFSSMTEQVRAEIVALPEDEVRTPGWAEEILAAQDPT